MMMMIAAQLEPPPPGFRGSPSYPYGHPGYFNGRGGGTPTDTYGPAPPLLLLDYCQA